MDAVGSTARAFVRDKGPKLLHLLGERPKGEEGWIIHPGGAFIRVESELDHLFERLIVVVFKPDALDTEAFQRWIKLKADAFHRYLEVCNLGRRQQLQIQTKLAVLILMRRLGHDPTDVEASLPEPPALLEALKRFTLDIERHISTLSDPDLKHLSAIRTYPIPGHHRRVLLGLDSLPYLIGHEHPPTPIDPISLFRGVAEEIMQRIEATHRGRRRPLKQARKAVEGLLSEIDAQPTNLRLIRKWIDARRPRRTWPWWLLLLLLTVALAWLSR